MNELEQKYIDHLERCFEKAERKESKLIPAIHEIMSMTGEKTRHFYNNLLDIDDAKYMEIGVWAGGSTCSAMFGNKASVVAIDNFTGFGSPRELFWDNFRKYKGDNDAVFIDSDCFTLSNNAFKWQFNIYLFDGDHSEESQYKALDYYLPCMDDVFIFVADDYNWKSVRDGTYRAIENNKLEIIWKKEIRLTMDNEFTHNQDEAKDTWWNGMGVFILKKT